MAAASHRKLPLQNTKMALDLVIGSYSYFVLQDSYILTKLKLPYPNYFGLLKRIKSYDHLLHQSLDKIFREHCLNDSEQIKGFIRSPKDNTDYNSIIKPILEQEPCLSRNFSKEMGKLSLLWIAVLGCYQKSAELLVRSGADVNELFGRHEPRVIDEEWTILHVLLQMDPSPENERLIRLVIDHGADLQARDYKERTVLYYAAISSRTQILEMLLKKGADVNAADKDGMTPMLAALSFSFKANELVPLLMKHGADVLTKNNIGENVLHCLAYICEEHAVDLARVFIEKGASLDDKKHFNHYQPIHLAIKMTQIELVELYLDHGANVNAPAKNGQSPLYVAAKYFINQHEIAKALLERGANVDQRSDDGSTALHAACEQRIMSEKFIRLLLSAGADLLAEDHDGKTPFARLSSRDNVKQSAFRLLIRELALKKVHQPSIELKDERIIERDPEMWKYYQESIEEIRRMKNTRFIGTCTFFQLLAKSQCQIAALMRNPEFEIKFKQCDLSGFHYADDVRRAFERARDHYESLVQREAVIDEAVYGILPYIIVRKVAHYTFDC